jgi:hypothetical protein
MIDLPLDHRAPRVKPFDPKRSNLFSTELRLGEPAKRGCRQQLSSAADTLAIQFRQKCRAGAQAWHDERPLDILQGAAGAIGGEQVRRLCERLWQYDQIVLDTTGSR